MFFTLPKSARLADEKAIRFLFKNGLFFKLDDFAAKCCLNDKPYSRFIVTASKASGNSPQRNRFKRLVREAIRCNRSNLKQNYDICFFIKKKPLSILTFYSIEHHIKWLFEKLNQCS